MAKKRESVLIASMSDLIDLVNHNCDLFESQIKKLTKSNRNLRLLGLAAIGFTLYTAVECKKQEEKVYQLSVRVQKLERGEGE